MKKELLRLETEMLRKSKRGKKGRGNNGQNILYGKHLFSIKERKKYLKGETQSQKEAQMSRTMNTKPKGNGLEIYGPRVRER